MGRVGVPDDAVCLEWDEVVALAAELADKVGLVHAVQPFDVMLVLPRGGLLPALILSQRLGFMSTQMLSASLSSYKGSSTQREASFTVGQFPTRKQLQGKRVLVVDEVCDTGNTLHEVRRRLLRRGVAEVVSAVVHYKPSQSQTGYVPDFYVAIDERWIDYPWEPHAKTRLQAVEPTRQTSPVAV